MQYNIYLPQTGNVFAEGDARQGIWLDSCADLDTQTIENIVKSRMRAICVGDPDEFVDLVVRVYRE